MRKLTVAVLIALSLAACGKKGDPKPPAEPAAQQQTESEKKKTQ